MICLVDACRKRNHEDCVGPLVTIAGVERNDDDRAPSFLRGIDRQLNEPNLSAEGRFAGRRHLARTVQKLGQGEFSPLFFHGMGLRWKAIVKARYRFFHSLPLPLFVERAKQVIQDTGDRSASRTLARGAQIPQKGYGFLGESETPPLLWGSASFFDTRTAPWPLHVNPHTRSNTNYPTLNARHF
jgi:hypothetical protein